MKIDISKSRVKPGSKVKLKDMPTKTKVICSSEAEYKDVLQQHVKELERLHDLLYGANKYAVLLVLQGMDTAGKDGAVKHVMSGVNPTGCEVTSFKQPSAGELEHDFLWRSYARLPRRGTIGIFNRSYYEEVLVVRVHPELLENQKLPKDSRGPDVWKRRFREINGWERNLTDNGIKIVKLFLNLSREEQRTRFLRRIDLPDHNWKFSSADVREREYWDDYQQAFSEMLTHTSTEWAPWYVIPADRKWFARIAAGAVIANTLIDIDPRYPTIDEEARANLKEIKKTLEAQAPPGAAADPFADTDSESEKS